MAIAGDFNPGIEDHRLIVRVLCQRRFCVVAFNLRDSVDPHEIISYQCNRQRKCAPAQKRYNCCPLLNHSKARFYAYRFEHSGTLCLADLPPLWAGCWRLWSVLCADFFTFTADIDPAGVFTKLSLVPYGNEAGLCR